jgi:hypothetical protein
MSNDVGVLSIGSNSRSRHNKMRLAHVRLEKPPMLSVEGIVREDFQ